MRTPTTPKPPLAVSLVCVLLVACGAHAAPGSTSDDADGPLAECEAFLSAYGHCLESLGPPRVAQARLEQTRAGLVAQAGRGEASRAALRRECLENLSQVQTTCR